MAIILEGSGTVTGITTFTTPLDDIKFDSIEVTGIATASTFQVGTGVSIGNPRLQNIALYTNDSEWVTVDNVGNVGFGTTNAQIAAQASNAKVINAGIVTANQYFGNQITAAGSRVTGVGTFENGLNITGNITNGLNVSAGIATLAADISIADKIVHTGDTNTAIRFPAADTITFETGGSERLRIDSSGRLLYGVNASISGVGFQFVNTYNQFYGVGNNANGTALDLVKTRATTASTNTVLQDADVIGEIKFRGSTSDQYVNGAVIKAIVNGTPGSGNDLPTDLAFRLMPDGSGSTLERLRIASDGKLLVGHTAAYGSSKTQIFNTAQYVLDLSTWSADANGPTVDFYKSRNATIGSATIVQNGDVVGRLRFLGNDGANARTAAQLTVESDGTPGTNDMPGRIVLATTADGASSPSERLRITSAGRVGIAENDPDTTLHVKVTSTEGIRLERSGGTVAEWVNDTDLTTFGTTNNFNVAFKTNGTERMRVTNGGLDPTTDAATDLGNSSKRWRDLYLSSGVFLGGTGSANELTDYEEGTFAPSYKASSANPTVGYQNQDGKYTKIGNVVYFQIYMRINSWSGGSGALYLDNLPFTSVNTGGYGGSSGILYFNAWGGDRITSCMISSNTTNLYLYKGINSGTSVNAGSADVGSSSQLRLNGMYHAS